MEETKGAYKGRGGRRSTTWVESWNHGKTCTIRVPVTLANQIKAVARAIDAGLEVSIKYPQN